MRGEQLHYECPRCGCKHFITDYTRNRGDYIYRKKHCRNCLTLIWTKEYVQMSRKKVK